MLKKDPWLGYVVPGRVFGNVYFVGTRPASTHLIDTGDGLIMIDPGYQDSLYLVLHNMYQLGFDPKDIRYIVISHGHGDHMNATRALVELTGAKTFLGRADLNRVRGLEATKPRIPFEPDVLIDDGDIISLGNTHIRCVTSPGHTPGTISFFFDATDGERVVRAGMHGGVGLNTLNREYFERTGEPISHRDDYFATLEKLKAEKVELFLGNHVGNNDTVGKLARVRDGETDAFLEEGAFAAFLEKCRLGLEELIEKEKNEV